MNFIKLKNKLVIEKYEIDQLVVRYGVEKENKFFGIQYFSTSQNIEPVISLIPERYRSDFKTLIMKINVGIPPHTDSKILSTINLYIKSDNCYTKFYKIKEQSEIKTTKLENQTNGSIFDPSSLEFVDEFCANDTEIFLLNVTKPHSVISPCKIYDERIAICLQSTIHNFDDVKNMLVETGNIE
jgi:hypothetical protein